MGWSWDKIAHEMGAGLDTVHWAAHKHAESNAHIRAVPPRHTPRAKPVCGVCAAAGWGVDASRGLDSTSGVSSLALSRKARMSGTLASRT